MSSSSSIFKTYHLVLCGLMSAVLCILSPLSIPIGPIPISLQTMVVCLIAYLLGSRLGTISVAVFLLLGMAGLPVFSGYTGGLAKLAGPTGGFLVGFLLTAYTSGMFAEKSDRKLLPSAIGMVLGTAEAYLFGTLWFVILMKTSVAYALSICVIPFIPFDLVKILIALLLGRAVYTAMQKAGVAV